MLEVAESRYIDEVPMERIVQFHSLSEKQKGAVRFETSVK